MNPLVKMLNITVGDLLDSIAEKYPEKEAIFYPENDFRMTYREFNDACRKLAKGLMALGIKKGDHVAIWATNIPEWILLQFATGKIGAVLVTVNTNYKSHELEYVLKQSDSTTLFLIHGFKDCDYIETVYSVVAELKNSEPGRLNSSKLPYLKNVIYIGEEKYPGMLNFDELYSLAEKITDDELRERQASLNPHEPINMQYTSGTTGFPKGVMLTHYNIINNAYHVGQCLKFSERDRLCIPVPFFHCFGCVLSTLLCVVYGATMLPLISFNPEKALMVVDKGKATAIHGVPTMFIMELNHPNFKKYDLSTLRTGIMAGAPCPIEVMRRVIDEMNCREITIAYGQTEASPVITQTRTDDPIEKRVETVGYALPGVEVKIIDPKTGETVPPGTQGELCARGYLVMKGYYKNPEATAEAIDKDGWLHTGDLATMDEEGYCKITGRIKEMVIRGGENIYPREIEEFLHTHPAIEDVQVIGVPDVKYGEELLAAIKLREGMSLTAEDVREFCRGKIARHKIPRYIEFVESYPMTASGKVQKFKLREIYTKKLGLEEASKIKTA